MILTFVEFFYMGKRLEILYPIKLWLCLKMDEAIHFFYTFLYSLLWHTLTNNQKCIKKVWKQCKRSVSPSPFWDRAQIIQGYTCSTFSVKCFLAGIERFWLHIKLLAEGWKLPPHIWFILKRNISKEPCNRKGIVCKSNFHRT